jgi:hypothetical protein
MHIRRALTYLFVTRRWATTALVAGAICLAFPTMYSTFFVRNGGEPRNALPNVLEMPPVAERTQQTPRVCYWKHAYRTCRPARTIRETLQIKRLLKEFPEGRFVYNRFTTMWRDMPETVVLKLNLASETTPTIPPPFVESAKFAKLP